MSTSRQGAVRGWKVARWRASIAKMSAGSAMPTEVATINRPYCSRAHVMKGGRSGPRQRQDAKKIFV